MISTRYTTTTITLYQPLSLQSQLACTGELLHSFIFYFKLGCYSGGIDYLQAVLIPILELKESIITMPHTQNSFFFPRSIRLLCLSLLGLSLLNLLVLLISATPAHASSVPTIEVSRDSAATGEYITIRGYNQPTEFELGNLFITGSGQPGEPLFLVFGQASIHPDGTFVWYGPIPKAGNGFADYDHPEVLFKVAKGEVTLGFGLFNGFSGGTTRLNLRDNTQGPFASRVEESGYAMLRLWKRTDLQVRQGTVNRSWLWGPSFMTLLEPYADAPGGWRTVSYYDKTRMEVTNPLAPTTNNPYYVSNGLLARELITGQRQLGDNLFEDRDPLNLPVAGDPDDKTGPVYSSLKEVLFDSVDQTGSTVVGVVDRKGHGGFDPEMKKYNITDAYYVADTHHNIASPFWDFLNQRTTVLDENGNSVKGRLFEPVFFATGLPITDAYWTKVKVGGQTKDVLIQAFERRILTYTPSNTPPFQVEMGNVGLHYYQWVNRG